MKSGEKKGDRELARILFVSTDMTAKEIAVRLGRTEKTIGNWRAADNWDDERTTRNVSPAQLIKRFNEEIEAILNSLKDDKGNKRPMNTKEADMIKKLTKGIKELRNAVDPQTAMEVLNGFMSYLALIELPLAQQIADHVLAYVRHKMKEAKEK